LLGSQITFVRAVILPGDFNGDGVVDAADYTVWRDNLGAPASTLLNDVDGGVIGVAQYNTWSADFGNSSGSSSLSNAVVPEPTSRMLFLLAAAFVAPGTASKRIKTRVRVSRKSSLLCSVSAGLRERPSVEFDGPSFFDSLCLGARSSPQLVMVAGLANPRLHTHDRITRRTK
jgi:hypothetical protein